MSKSLRSHINQPFQRVLRKLRLRHFFLRQRLNLIALNIYRQGLISVPITLEDANYYLAAVAIFRGEDPYLREWLDFHLLMGVEHFFLYDNGLEESSRELLQPYVDDGVVTHIPWPDLPGLRNNNWAGPHTLSIQQLAYGHCVRNFRRNFKWLMQLDLDEFMFPASNKYQCINSVLKSLDADKVMGICVRSLTFGSSGHIKRPPGLVIENFTWSKRTLDPYVKSISHAKYLASDLFMGPHWFHYRIWREIQQRLLGYPSVIKGKAANALFRLNHYELKSQAEYLAKSKINAKGYMAGKENLKRFMALDESANEIENCDILRFLPMLKRRHENPSGKPQPIR